MSTGSDPLPANGAKPKKRRRPLGSDSFYFFKERNLWAASTSLGSGVGGRRVRRTFYGKTKGEAKRKLDDEKARHGGTLPAPSKTTVVGFIDAWLERKIPELKPTTRSVYENAWRHTRPLLGNVKLTKFDSDAAEQLYAQLERKGVTVSVRKKIHVLLHAAFETAKKLPKNPVRGLSPSYDPKRKKRFSKKEAQTFIKAVEGHRLGALFICAIKTGLRQGELLALRWKDVDFQKRRISVEFNLSEVAGKIELLSPKTDASERIIPMPPGVVKAMKKRKELAESEGHHSEFVFTTRDGKWIRKSNLRREIYYPLLRSSGLPLDVTFHDLRRTCFSLLGDLNVHPKTVAGIAGHEDEAVTSRHYTTLDESLQATALKKLDALLDGKPTARRKPKAIG